MVPESCAPALSASATLERATSLMVNCWPCVPWPASTVASTVVHSPRARRGTPRRAEREGRGGAGADRRGEGVEVGLVAGVADAEGAHDALAGRDRGRGFGLVGSDGDGGDREHRDRDGRRERLVALAVRAGVGGFGAGGNWNVRLR